ncbi:MAG: zinc ribbon domain-containing protein [Chloroflexi bacterium SZAS-1]|nr:zinc ribbon domain-containing protein [Chloroflexi bacterium SZAS-1]
MNCRTCQEEIPPTANFCPNCGTPLHAATQPEADDSPNVAAIGPTERLEPTLPPLCPKCQTLMVRGFIPEDTYAGRTMQVWIEGKPETSKWTGEIVTKRRRQWYVRSYRCSFCGYVESYARQEVVQPWVE